MDEWIKNHRVSNKPDRTLYALDRKGFDLKNQGSSGLVFFGKIEKGFDFLG